MQVQNKVIGVLAKSLFLLLNKSRRVYEGDEAMLTKSFIEFLYDAAHIQRWNEHIRPSGFTELDKQAHKMMIMYVLARHEEDDHGAQLNWRLLIEGGIFEFLQRNVLTDIKPQIFHEMCVFMARSLMPGFIRSCGGGFLIFRKILWKKCSSILRTRNTALWKKRFYALHIIWQQNGNLS